MGHARAILGTPSAERQLELYQRILREGLSVRKVEALAQESKGEKKTVRQTPANPYEELQKELTETLGHKVKIQEGKITISYTGFEELEQIIAKLR
jgi:ParB family chromosome partitioning protein